MAYGSRKMGGGRTNKRTSRMRSDTSRRSRRVSSRPRKAAMSQFTNSPARMNRNGGNYVYADSGKPYNGMVMEHGGRMVTTHSGTFEGEMSRTVIPKPITGQVTQPGTGGMRQSAVTRNWVQYVGPPGSENQVQGLIPLDCNSHSDCSSQAHQDAGLTYCGHATYSIQIVGGVLQCQEPPSLSNPKGTHY